MMVRISSGVRSFSYTDGWGGSVPILLEAQREMEFAEAALRRGDMIQARRLLAQLLRGDSENLAAWRLLLRALQNLEHRQRAAREILRLAPGDAEAQMALKTPNRALPRVGSRVRVPAFGELSHDDDPFGELATYRARNGLPVPQMSNPDVILAPFAQHVFPGAGRFPRVRLPRIALRMPGFWRRTPVARNVGRRLPWRSLLAIIGGGALLGGAYLSFTPLDAPFLASALPADPDDLPHPALAYISYPTEKLQALGLDEPRRNTLEGTVYDLYHFDGVRGLLLSVDVISLDSLLDPVVELYDLNGKLVNWNDNGDFSFGRGTLDSRLEVVLPSDGRYLISVGGIVGDGKYIISMRNH